MHETQEAPLPSARFREEAPLQRSSPGPWQQEFLQRERPQNVQHQQSRLGHANLDYPLHTYHSASYSHGYRAPASEQHVESHEKASFDEEAFEKAFNLASQELQEDKVDQPPASEAYNVPDQSINYRIGSDRIFDDSLKRQEENSEVREADELARTAGQLLENVKHDQSTKFQESSFLSLMRQLRDKEVKVDGDNIVNVSFAPRRIACR